MERLRIINSHISSSVLPETVGNRKFLQLKTISKLNNFDYEVSSSLNNAIDPSKQMILYSGYPKYFCTGGDLRYLFENPDYTPEFYNQIYSILWKLSKIPSTCALVRGYAIGLGVSLSGVCKVRIAFASSIWSFPQNTVGLPTDVGCSYILSHLPCREIGLYLALTGEKIDGNDAYWCGLATHFVEDKEYDNVLKDLKAGMDILTVAEKYHTFPARERSFIAGNESQIINIFQNAGSIEGILQRAAAQETELGDLVLRTLGLNCPLTLKISLKSFQNARNWKESLIYEFKMDHVLQLNLNYNVATAKKHKLVDKKPGRVAWEPNDIHSVTRDMIEEIQHKATGIQINLK